jgi:hypothetical protein
MWFLMQETKNTALFPMLISSLLVRIKLPRLGVGEVVPAFPQIAGGAGAENKAI